jgi:hypothetical protein
MKGSPVRPSSQAYTGWPSIDEQSHLSLTAFSGIRHTATASGFGVQRAAAGLPAGWGFCVLGFCTGAHNHRGR